MLDMLVDPVDLVDEPQPTQPSNEPTVFRHVKWISGALKGFATKFVSTVFGTLGKKIVMIGVIPLKKLPITIVISGPVTE
jgi:hypothetical protein